MDTNICPICKLEASVSRAPGRDVWIIICDRCGKFCMIGGLRHKNWSNVPQEDVHLIPYLSAYTRQKFENGTEAELGFNNWRDCARQHSNTSTEQKKHMLLVLIAGRTPRVGQSIQFNCELDYPLIDAASVDECHQILTHLHEQRYVNAIIYQGFEYVVTVTVEGREYLEQTSTQVIDRVDIEAVPEAARYDLMKAASRFKDGDLGGALAAACSAVDAACTRVYEEHGLGDLAKHSFRQKVKTALKKNGTLQQLESELINIGWDRREAHQLVENLEASLNRAAIVMQMLRSHMSDAHGSKTALTAVVYDAFKWATIIQYLRQNG